ncbi:MAG TPA: tetratricopeptide repeat protein [Lacipirellulaceae bacterium]
MKSLLFVLCRRLLLLALTMFAGLATSEIAVAQETDAETETAEAGAEGEAPRTAADITLEEAQAAAKEGEEAIAAKDYDKAFAAYTKLLQYGSVDPFNRQLAVLMGYTGRGMAMAGMEEYEAAIEEFKLATDVMPNFTPALVARGQMFLEAGAADQALPDFEAAVKSDRTNLPAQFGLGKSYVMLGYAPQAIKPLTRVLAADPQNAEAYRLRGIGYAGVYKINEALADLQEAISLNPEDYEAYFSLGAIYLREEKFDEAAAEFARSIQHYKPKKGQEDVPYVQGHLTLASAHIEHGKAAKDEATKQAAYQAAIDQSETLLKLLDEKNPAYAPYRAAALHGRGIGERMKGEFGKAIKSFTEALKLSPDLAETYFRRGICFHLIGEDKMAISDFVQSANLNVEEPDPRANLWEGFTHAKLGDYLEAVRAYGNAIAASDRYTPAYVNRGLAYVQLKEYDKAIADFNEAIRLEPTQAEHYYKRGIAYEQLGDLEKAAASFASAIQFNDKHEGAYRRMAAVMQALGRSEQAAEFRQKAAELAPERASR